jgi:hypothetical protein
MIEAGKKNKTEASKPKLEDVSLSLANHINCLEYASS